MTDKSSDKSEQDKAVASDMLKHDTDIGKSAREMHIATPGQEDFFLKRYAFSLSQRNRL